ncbi:MAG: hypothetical protein K2Z81_01815 [Cyanobacteria bacterium]|nr:hypothetical protein [Cyanobacteriota bacterium]
MMNDNAALRIGFSHIKDDFKKFAPQDRQRLAAQPALPLERGCFLHFQLLEFRIPYMRMPAQAFVRDENDVCDVSGGKPAQRQFQARNW